MYGLSRSQMIAPVMYGLSRSQMIAPSYVWFVTFADDCSGLCMVCHVRR